MTGLRLIRPRRPAAARAMLAAEPGAVAVAGGQLVVPALWRRELRPEVLVDLSTALEAGIEPVPGGLRIGAGATLAALGRDAAAARILPLLPLLLREVTDPAVRSRATLGGSLSARERGSDLAALCLALGATVETTAGRQAATDWHAEPAPPRRDRLVLALHLPAATAAAHVKLLDPASRYPELALCLAEGDGMRRAALSGRMLDRPRLLPADDLPDDAGRLGAPCMRVPRRWSRHGASQRSRWSTAARSRQHERRPRA